MEDEGLDPLAAFLGGGELIRMGANLVFRPRSFRSWGSLLAVATVCILARPVMGRTWTSINGMTREAELAGRQGSRVILSSDGQRWAVELQQLVPADRDYVERNTGPAARQAAHELRGLLDQLRTALGERRLDEVEPLLARAMAVSSSDAQRGLVLEAQQLSNQVLLFWKAAETTVQWIEPGQELTLPISNVAGIPSGRLSVIRRDAAGVLFQSAERQYLIRPDDWQAVPGALAAALARRSLPASPQGMQALHSFRAIDLMADAADAWAVAQTRALEARPIPQGPPRAPSPQQFEIEVAKIRELLKSDYEAARVPERRLELAKTLYEQAEGLRADDRVSYFVLMWESARLLADLGRLEAAMSLVSALEQTYDIERLEQRKGALVATAARVPKQDDELHLPILKSCFLLADQAILADEFDVAAEVLDAATATTNMLQDRVVKIRYKTQLAEWKNRLRRERADFETVREARPQLLQTPDDPVANRTVGHYAALRRNQWKAGLPHLARAGQDPLAEAARRDLTGAETPDEQVALGNLWWDFSQQRDYEAHADALKARAVYWYEQARADVRGSNKVLVDVRLEEYQQQRNQQDAPGQISLTSLRPLAMEGVYLRAGESLVRRNLRVGDQDRELALWAQPSEDDGVTRIGYRLNREYLKLRGVVGFDNAYRSNVRIGAILFGANGVVLPAQGAAPGTWNPVAFRIQNEKGKVLWGPTLVTSGNWVEFNIPVGNSEAVFLVTACQGNYLQAPAVWGDPVLVRK